MSLEPGNTVARSRAPWVREVTSDAIQHFIWGIGDNNPRWLSAGVAPPSFLYAVDETTVAPGHQDARRIYSSVDWTWYDEIRIGAEIEAAVALTGESPAEVGTANYAFSQAGRVDFSANEVDLASALVTCRRSDHPPTAVDDRAELRYTPQELDAIEATILAESRRGAEPLLAEQVSVGDSLGPLVKGPLSIMDVVAWCAGTQGVVADGSVSEGGLHAQSATGPQQVAWIIQVLTDWIGDGGFLHRLVAEVETNPPLGSTTTITGEVVEVFERPAPGFVAALEAVNQSGETSASARATVLMPSDQGGVELPVTG